MLAIRNNSFPRILLTHPPNFHMLVTGSTYSVNEAREPDWPDGLRRYIGDMKTGSGQSGEKFDLVYVCSLVADVHYTLFEGGIAMNPRQAKPSCVCTLACTCSAANAVCSDCCHKQLSHLFKRLLMTHRSFEKSAGSAAVQPYSSYSVHWMDIVWHKTIFLFTFASFLSRLAAVGRDVPSGVTHMLDRTECACPREVPKFRVMHRESRFFLSNTKHPQFHLNSAGVILG